MNSPVRGAELNLRRVKKEYKDQRKKAKTTKRHDRKLRQMQRTAVETLLLVATTSADDGARIAASSQLAVIAADLKSSDVLG